ncbi:hypothetical protein SERLA73DRAFT_156341 [Serpula lacrymans var. lacrymans S7.3]|uniref:Uncharacterized protein n=2 Tax=Serpula lacrymans var. lacrymans TaxID=341189 RepID=F8QE24_SERL3|nr:uncharacterized protein SERLADRAFT_412025 [Serpula lacrymans var. lacrymans S7.9]EGN93399.1 hypothetical protein SERLA73DRAFT_156341 [Serpula lacrymans var. lacrymans S7.3]EGO18779.1 hypothetical protein SERLADRAFT_412025 [Serpula lacrymans var. lacrymans S7.9]
MYVEEQALGYQLQCRACQDGSDNAQMGGDYCYATTNYTFWEKWEFWETPANIPIFFKCCAITYELFDLIIEFHPTSTSSGLLENNKYVQENWSHVNTCKLYQTYTGICISINNMFKAANKVTVATKQKAQIRMLKGGILSVVNKRNEIIAWVGHDFYDFGTASLPQIICQRLCQSQSNTEIEELFVGLKHHYNELGIALPEMVIADNCCHIHSAVLRVMPDAQLGLNVFHPIMRYLATIVNGTKNPFCTAVARELSNAIYKTRAN